MDDRYELNINCSYCNNLNKEIWYAPTSSSDTFRCEKCGRYNFITDEFKAMKIEEIDLSDIENGFDMTTNYEWSNEEIQKMCEDRLNQIRGNI